MSDQNLLKTALVFLVVAAVLYYLTKGSGMIPNIGSVSGNGKQWTGKNTNVPVPANSTRVNQPAGVNEKSASDGYLGGCPTPQGLFVSADLLPKPVPNEEDFTIIQPKDLTGQNFLEATRHIGIDTVGQSLRNSNRQLRSDPSIPLVPVSIWNNTTITPDLMQRPFNIDDCTSYKSGLGPKSPAEIAKITKQAEAQGYTAPF